MKRFIACFAISAASFLTSATMAAPPKAAPAKAKPTTKPSAKPAGVVVQGKIKAIASTPHPGTVPYKDCFAAVELTGTKASKGKLPSTILVYIWTMRANKLTPQASLKPGQTVKFAVQPWDKVEGKYGRYQRRELNSDEALELDAYFGETTK